MLENHRKVSFNITSNASYIYNFSGQKFIKNGQLSDFMKTWSFLSNSVTRQVTFNWIKIGENPEIENFQCDILTDFWTFVSKTLSAKKYDIFCNQNLFGHPVVVYHDTFFFSVTLESRNSARTF